MTDSSRAWIQRARAGGGGGGRTPTPFCAKFFKNSLNWPKKSWGRAPESPAPPPFSNPRSTPGSHLCGIYFNGELGILIFRYTRPIVI